MMTEDCKSNCDLAFLGTALVVIVVWVITLLILWSLRRRRKVSGSEQEPNCNQEMTSVTNTKEDANLIYSQIQFPNGVRQPKQKSEELTYAEVKGVEQQDDGVTYAEVKVNVKALKNKSNINSENEITYAEIKSVAQASQPQDGNTDLYACVNKKKP